MGPSKRIRVTLIYELRRKLSFKNVELLISANVAEYEILSRKTYSDLDSRVCE